MKKMIVSSAMLIIVTGLLLFSSFGASAIAGNSFGHSASDPYFSLVYDVEHDQLVSDLTPGFNTTNVVPATDPNPGPFLSLVHGDYYIAYVNMQNIRSYYMALDNYSLGSLSMTTPSQVLIQGFRTPGGRYSFVENAFVGLIAYRQTPDGLPHGNNTVYLAQTLIDPGTIGAINTYFDNNVDGIAHTFSTVAPTVTPVPVVQTVSGNNYTYTWGIDYQNLFVLWHAMNDTNPVNGSIDAGTMMGRVVAISELSYVNFSYTMTGNQVSSTSGFNAVNTKTNYAIGPVTDLWILNDTSAIANHFGGQSAPITASPITIGHYNTTDSIFARLGGNSTTPGMSLGVVNFARIVELSAQTDDTSSVQADNTTVSDPTTIDMNITRGLNFSLLNQPAFDINFNNEPNYILNGNTSNPIYAPVRLLPNIMLAAPEALTTVSLANQFIMRHVTNLVKVAVDQKDIDQFNVLAGHILYVICFPEWGGQSVMQDPTFTAYAALDTSSIDGAPIFAITLLMVGTASLLVWKVHRRAH